MKATPLGILSPSAKVITSSTLKSPLWSLTAYTLTAFRVPTKRIPSGPGVIDRAVLAAALLCLPVTLAGAWLGARLYLRVAETLFRRVVLLLLLVSGLVLLGQGLGR